MNCTRGRGSNARMRHALPAFPLYSRVKTGAKREKEVRVMEVTLSPLLMEYNLGGGGALRVWGEKRQQQGSGR